MLSISLTHCTERKDRHCTFFMLKSHTPVPEFWTGHILPAISHSIRPKISKEKQNAGCISHTLPKVEIIWRESIMQHFSHTHTPTAERMQIISKQGYFVQARNLRLESQITSRGSAVARYLLGQIFLEREGEERRTGLLCRGLLLNYCLLMSPTPSLW